MAVIADTLSICLWVTDNSSGRIKTLGAIARGIVGGKYVNKFLSWDDIISHMANPFASECIIDNCVNSFKTRDDVNKFNWWDVSYIFMNECTIDKNDAFVKKCITKEDKLEQISRKELVQKFMDVKIKDNKKFNVLGLGAATVYDVDAVVEATKGVVVDIDAKGSELIRKPQFWDSGMVFSKVSIEDGASRLLVDEKLLPKLVSEIYARNESATKSGLLGNTFKTVIYRYVNGRVIQNIVPAMYEDVDAIKKISSISIKTDESSIKMWKSISDIYDIMGDRNIDFVPNELRPQVNILLALCCKFADVGNTKMAKIKKGIEKIYSAEQLRKMNELIIYIDASKKRKVIASRIYKRLGGDERGEGFNSRDCDYDSGNINEVY